MTATQNRPEETDKAGKNVMDFFFFLTVNLPIKIFMATLSMAQGEEEGVDTH